MCSVVLEAVQYCKTVKTFKTRAVGHLRSCAGLEVAVVRVEQVEKAMVESGRELGARQHRAVRRQTAR